jgi:hypothetical protein
LSLRTTRPTRRDASSILQFCKRVPTDILGRARGQPIVLRLPGLKHEGEIIVSGTIGDVVKFSLKTRDPEVAKARTAWALTQIDASFDVLRAGPIPLSHKQIVALSGEVYRFYIRQFSDNPGDPNDWAAVKAVNRAAREGRLFNVPPLRLEKALDSDFASKHFGPDLTSGVNALPTLKEKRAMEDRFGDLVNWALTLHGLAVETTTRTAFWHDFGTLGSTVWLRGCSQCGHRRGGGRARRSRMACRMAGMPGWGGGPRFCFFRPAASMRWN